MPRKLKRVIIREELVALTGDYKKAVLLHELEYRQSQAIDIDRYIAEEGERLRQREEEPNIKPRNGWFRRTSTQLSRDTLLNLSRSNTLVHIKALVENGWVEERPDPADPKGKARLYRLNLVKMMVDLEEIGYQLEGWKLDTLYSDSEQASSETKQARFRTKQGGSKTEPYLNSKPINIEDCADCNGTGFWYPNGYEGGVAKCRHGR